MSNESGSKQWCDAIQNRKGSGDAKTWEQTVANQRKQQPSRVDGVTHWKAYLEMRRKLAGPDGRSRSKGHPAGKKKGGQRLGRTLPKTNLHSDRYRERLLALHSAGKGASGKQEIKPKDQSQEPKKPAQNLAITPAATPLPASAKNEAPAKQVELRSPSGNNAPKPSEAKARSEQVAMHPPNRSDDRKQWATRMYKSAAEHFKKVTDRSNRSRGEAAKKPKPTQPTKPPQQQKGSGPSVQNMMRNTQARSQGNMVQVANHGVKQKSIDAGAIAQKQANLQHKMQAQQPPPPPPRPKK